jgi:cytoskeleton protein RodZ
LWKILKMTEITDNGNLVAAQPENRMQQPGELIRGKREAAGMSQAQIGEALHLTLHYIKALENDEYAKLPGLTFVKGYFRSYCRLLKIDENEILDCYDRYVSTLGLQTSSEAQTLRVRRRNDQSVLWAIVAGMILIVGLGAGWWFYGRQEVVAVPRIIATPQSSQPGTQLPAPQRSSAVPVAPAPAAQTPPAAPAESFATSAVSPDPATGTTLMTEDGLVVLDDPVTGELAADPVADLSATDELSQAALQQPADAVLDAQAAAPEVQSLAQETALDSPGGSRRVERVGNGSDQLELEFSVNSWVEVDDASRVRQYSGMMQRGDTLSIRAAAPFYVLLGDATGVELRLNSQQLGVGASVRADNTARINVSAEGVSAWAVE